MKNAVNSISLMSSNGCDDSEKALHKSIERVAGEILPNKDASPVNGNNAPNPRNNPLYSITKQAVERQLHMIQYAQDTIETLELALRDAKWAKDKAVDLHKRAQKDFELAIDTLKIEVNADEDELLGYGKE